MPTLKPIVEGSDTRLGRGFDFFIQFLIVASLVTFTIETLPDLSEPARDMLRYTEIVTVIIFTAEYLLRLYVADRKLSLAFSFWANQSALPEKLYMKAEKAMTGLGGRFAKRRRIINRELACVGKP